MSTRTHRKHFNDATVFVHREGGKPTGSRIESVMGTFVTSHWPSKIADVRVEERLGLLVVETKKGETRFFGHEEALAESSAGGSMGGHDPRAHGQMRFIIRAFGKWADGRHEVCVKRIRTEHPEVAKGKNVNALCAWLKDQWAGTTKWRGRSDDPKQAAEDKAIQAKARATAHARFTHSMPMPLDDTALQTLVEDVQALTGITPEDVLREVGGDKAVARLADQDIPEADRDDVFEALWEAEVDLSARELERVEVAMRGAVARGSFQTADPSGLVESWLSLMGAPAEVDEDPATVMECMRRITADRHGAPRSLAESQIAAAVAGVERALTEVSPVEVYSMANSQEGRDLTAIAESSTSALSGRDDLADAITSTESTAVLQGRVFGLLEAHGLDTLERREAVRRATRSQLVQSVALLDVGVGEGDPIDDLEAHKFPQAKAETGPGRAAAPRGNSDPDLEDLLAVKEADAAETTAALEALAEVTELIEGEPVHVSGYTTKSGKKVSSYWRGTGEHAGIKGKTKAEVVSKIAAKTTRPGLSKSPAAKSVAKTPRHESPKATSKPKVTKPPGPGDVQFSSHRPKKYTHGHKGPDRQELEKYSFKHGGKAAGRLVKYQGWDPVYDDNDEFVGQTKGHVFWQALEPGTGLLLDHDLQDKLDKLGPRASSETAKSIVAKHLTKKPRVAKAPAKKAAPKAAPKKASKPTSRAGSDSPSGLVLTAIEHLYDKGISEGRKHQHLKAIAKVPSSVLEGMERPDLIDLANAADERGHAGLTKRVDAIIANMDKGKKAPAAKAKAPHAEFSLPEARATYPSVATNMENRGMDTETLLGRLRDARVSNLGASNIMSAAGYGEKFDEKKFAKGLADYGRKTPSRWPYRSGDDQPRPFHRMPTDQLKAALADPKLKKDAWSYGDAVAAAKHRGIRSPETQGVKVVDFGNGRPMLHRDSKELVRSRAAGSAKPSPSSAAKAAAAQVSPGRGPSGNLRNFTSMSDAKLTGVYEHPGLAKDADARSAVTAEMERRGLIANDESDKPKAQANTRAGVPKYKTSELEDMEWDEFEAHYDAVVKARDEDQIKRMNRLIDGEYNVPKSMAAKRKAELYRTNPRMKELDEQREERDREYEAQQKANVAAAKKLPKHLRKPHFEEDNSRLRTTDRRNGVTRDPHEMLFGGRTGTADAAISRLGGLTDEELVTAASYVEYRSLKATKKGGQWRAIANAIAVELDDRDRAEGKNRGTPYHRGMRLGEERDRTAKRRNEAPKAWADYSDDHLKDMHAYYRVEHSDPTASTGITAYGSGRAKVAADAIAKELKKRKVKFKETEMTDDVLEEALAIVDENAELEERQPTRAFSSYSAGRGPNARGEVVVRRNLKTGSYRKYNVSGRKPKLIGSGGASRARVQGWSRAKATLKAVGATSAPGNNRINTKRLRTAKVTSNNVARVKVFQAKHGLKVDGQLGPKTAAVLKKVRARRRTSSL